MTSIGSAFVVCRLSFVVWAFLYSRHFSVSSYSSVGACGFRCVVLGVDIHA